MAVGQCRRHRGTGGPPVTNIRQPSPQWAWLAKAGKIAAWCRSTVLPNTHRSRTLRPKKKDVCLVLRSTTIGRWTCFAGIWTEFKGDRGTKSKRTNK